MDDPSPYPLDFAVDYPDRELDRLTTLLRPLAAIPIVLLLATVAGPVRRWEPRDDSEVMLGAGGLLLLGPMLMLLFRRKYPRWWFDWNLELLRFTNRVAVYLALMDDRYPSTDEPQAVWLEVPYPEADQELSRWLPLVKWLLALPHYLVLAVLTVGAIVAVLLAWLAILFTGRYPPTLFRYVEGVMRWHNRVVAYAIILVTDRYPPFHLA